AGHGPADLGDAEGVEEAGQLGLAGALDGVDQLPRGDVREAVELLDLLDRDVEELRQALHEAGLDEEPGGTLAQALDVEAAAAGEVRDAPHELGGALERVRADRVRALAHERRAAARALAGHRERGAALVAGVDALHDLGDHVAGAL